MGKAVVMKVPDFAVEPLAFLLSRKQKSLDSILSALRELEPVASFGQLYQQIASSAGIQQAEAVQIVGLLTSLFTSHPRDLSSDDFVDAVCSAVERDGREKLQTNARTNARLRSFLAGAFELEDKVSIATKAQYLLSEHQRFWGSSEILTDIRHVFHEDPSKRPAGALIFHALKIGYSKSGEYKEAYFALEPDDLDGLREILDRAKEKEATLRALIEESGIKCLN